LLPLEGILHERFEDESSWREKEWYEPKKVE